MLQKRPSRPDSLDYISMWFDVRKEFGVNDNIYYGSVQKETSEVSWTILRHQDTDGLGGMARVLREQGYPCTKLPVTWEKAPLKGWKLWKAIWRGLFSKGPKKVMWRRVFPDNQVPNQVSWALFSKEETVAIKKAARRNKVVLPVLIFWALNRALGELMLQPGKKYRWFFPINLRGAIAFGHPERNHASGIEIIGWPEMSPGDLRQVIKEETGRGMHWGLWYLAQIGRFIGRSGVRWVYSKLQGSSQFVGSFSILGELPFKEPGNPPEDPTKSWVACGPGSPSYPVSTGVLLWHGSLSLSLLLQPNICDDQSVSDAVLHRWRDILIHYSLGDPGSP